jgi:hypothetical protein
MINLCPLLAFGLIGPIISILHIENGHGDVSLNKRVEGVLIISLYTFHL